MPSIYIVIYPSNGEKKKKLDNKEGGGVGLRRAEGVEELQICHFFCEKVERYNYVGEREKKREQGLLSLQCLLFVARLLKIILI